MRDELGQALAEMLAEARPCTLGCPDQCGTPYVGGRAGLSPCCVARRALAELSAPPEPTDLPRPLTHAFRPHRKYPWFCSECGYGEVSLNHHPAEPGVTA